MSYDLFMGLGAFYGPNSMNTPKSHFINLFSVLLCLLGNRRVCSSWMVCDIGIGDYGTFEHLINNNSNNNKLKNHISTT